MSGAASRPLGLEWPPGFLQRPLVEHRRIMKLLGKTGEDAVAYLRGQVSRVRARPSQTGPGDSGVRASFWVLVSGVGDPFLYTMSILVFFFWANRRPRLFLVRSCRWLPTGKFADCGWPPQGRRLPCDCVCLVGKEYRGRRRLMSLLHVYDWSWHLNGEAHMSCKWNGSYPASVWLRLVWGSQPLSKMMTDGCESARNRNTWGLWSSVGR